MTLTARVKERATELGFDLVGVAEAGPLPRDGARLAAWLAEDRHAGMAYMAQHSEKRADPRMLLPGCKSVIALAASYWPGEEEAQIPDGRAKVALYARGRDYHKVLGDAARALATWLTEESGLAAQLRHPRETAVDCSLKDRHLIRPWIDHPVLAHTTAIEELPLDAQVPLARARRQDLDHERRCALDVGFRQNV